MDFAQQQRNPSKHLIGFGFVILLHVGIAYALMMGLGKKVIAALPESLVTKIIEEVQPPPPPPDVPPPPPPDFKAPPPPPSFVPPPEVQVAAPPPTNAIQQATTVKPADTTFAPAPPPVQNVPPAPPAPPSVRGLCSNVKEVGEAMQDKFVALAAKEEITHAEATVELVIGPGGEIKSARVTKSSNPKVNSLAVGAVKRLACRGQGTDVTTYYPVEFTLKDE
ncbi:TonB C-terminal domain-containing protein [Chitinimonas arctica]|uniref:TonB C-terminal domain-containing protein n=1 Tax=Chitinimonas arctica TaxID=2594795 RepID=UPI0021E0DD0D|nr:TonB C-terminal domain-containing protein [Chitinimonas arctica]